MDQVDIGDALLHRATLPGISTLAPVPVLAIPHLPHPSVSRPLRPSQETQLGILVEHVAGLLVIITWPPLARVLTPGGT